MAAGRALLLVAVFLVALVVPPTVAQAANWLTAEATFTGKANDAAGTFLSASADAACGFGAGPLSLALPEGFLAGFSLDSSPLGGSAPQRGCGTCVEVKCTGSSCMDSNPVTVMLYDNCGGCAPGGLNLHAAAFAKIAPLSLGRVPIAYRQVACPAKGDITAVVHDLREAGGGYARLAFKNVAGGPLSSVEVASAGSNTWVPLKNTYGAVWEKSQLPALPFDLRLTDAQGKAITVRAAITSAKNGEVPIKGQF